MKICAELVNYSEDSSEESEIMQLRNSKNGKGFLKVLCLQEGGSRLVLMIKVP